MRRSITAYVALLRAVNVGGTGKLPMTELIASCVRAGFAHPRTYIASGNAIFASDADAVSVRDMLERELRVYAGQPVGVIVRTGAEMADVLARNPFADRPANRTTALFTDVPLEPEAITTITGVADEQVELGPRVLYIAYGSGMADSRLKIPCAKTGTARNMNTVARLAAMAAG